MIDLKIEKIDLAQYGVKIIKKKDTSYRVLIHKSEDKKNLPPLVGLEYEGRFSPSLKQAREIRTWAQANSKIIKEITTGRTDWTPDDNRVKLWDLQSVYSIKSLAAYVFYNLSHLVHAHPHNDGGGLESVLLPATEKAHRALKGEYGRLLKAYKQLGFTPVVGGDGIHANIDYTAFGDTWDAQVDAMERMIFFLLPANDFLVDFSNRQFTYQSWVDVYALLGDEMRVMDDAEFLKKFKEQKGGFFKRLRERNGNTTYSDRFLNLSFARDGRQCVEYRHFASTQNVDHLMSKIEYAFAVPAFARQQRDESTMLLQNFVRFVKRNVERFPHLWERMTQIEASQPYTLLEASVEQATISTATQRRTLKV